MIESTINDAVTLGSAEALLAGGVRKTVHNNVQLWEGGPYWADTNIGAEKPEDFGFYFWWGDTVGYKFENGVWVASDGSSANFSFDEENTPTNEKTLKALKNDGWIAADYSLMHEHDAAYVKWGADWRMPTYLELYDLCTKCKWNWTQRNGVNGYVVCGKGAYASASIFLPNAGFGLETSLYSVGSYGYYWSSVPSPYIRDAFSLSFLLGKPDTNDGCHRYYGQSVRPVQGFAK